jgi:hypothetical protein
MHASVGQNIGNFLRKRCINSLKWLLFNIVISIRVASFECHYRRGFDDLCFFEENVFFSPYFDRIICFKHFWKKILHYIIFLNIFRTHLLYRSGIITFFEVAENKHRLIY